MLKAKKRWKLQTPDQSIVDRIVRDGNLHPLMARILAIRGIDSSENISRFFNMNETLLHDPFLFKDMKKATERIKLAIIKSEKILIYGDYDADGVTSTALLYRILVNLGANVSFYIPNRFSEGYGLNNEAIEEAKKNNVKLIITVDTGISAIEGALLAKALEICLIITDHHEPKANLPDAFAIINPKVTDETYPFKYLAGVGVAFKLAHALLGRIPTEYIDIVAIGTISDLVPLIDENRIIAYLGLKQMQNTINVGIRSLIEQNGLINKKLTVYHIGFIIGPRINASGRLESSKEAVQLLITEDMQEAIRIVKEINSTNQERQALVKQITEEALGYIELNNLENDKVLVIANEGWNIGVIGIVASQILDRFYKPTIILSIDSETKIAKGSCRSIEGYNIYEALASMDNLLMHYGGHPAAAGLSIKEEHINIFSQRLNQLAGEWLDDSDFLPYEHIDLLCKLDEIDIDFISQIKRLEPFGMGNPHPKVLIDEVAVSSVMTLGNEGQHLKLNIKNKNNDIEAIYFKNGVLVNEIANHSEIQLIGELDINEWNGRIKSQLIVKDLKIDSIQVFDWRDLPAEIINTKISDNNNVVFYNQDVGNEATLNGWRNLIEYSSWKDKGWDAKAIFLLHLPTSINLLKEILISFKKLEKVYCIFNDFHNRKTEEIIINRELFKKVYIALLKNDSLRNYNTLENYFNKNNINSKIYKFVLDVFKELDLILLDGDKIIINNKSDKTDLTKSEIYQKYLEQEEIKRIFLYSNHEDLRNWFLTQYY